MIKGLFFGLTTVDIFNGVSRHPGPNEKMRADWQVVSAGGPAANAAVAFAALGGNSHLCTAVGRHSIGQLAASDLTDHGVELHDHAHDQDQLPVISSILVNSATSERAVIYSNHSGSAVLSGIDYEELLAGCKVLMLDGFYPEQALMLIKAAKRGEIVTVLDGGSWKEGLEPLLAHIDYAICSADFRPPDCTSTADVFAYLAEQGVGKVAVSRGAEPLLLYDNGTAGSLEVPEIEALDTLGAGDILHGAFCYYITRKTFVESIQGAVRIATESCRYRGTRQWIRELQ